MIPERLAARVSLKLRVLALTALVMLGALGGGTAVLVHNAREAIASEVASSMQLAKALLTTAMRTREAPTEAELRALGATLDAMRHVRVVLATDYVTASALASAMATGHGVPDWFARLLMPPPPEPGQLVIPFGRGGRAYTIVGDPHDELREIWDDALIASGFVLGGGALLLGLLYLALRVGLQPLSRLLVAFEALEQGRFGVRVNERAAPELGRINRGFNHVATALERMVDDNRRLAATLMSLQEDERKAIAHDLHDEMAPQLFCMRVALAAAREAGTPADLAARLDAMDHDLVGLQSQVRRLLTRLRPHALDAFGLEGALADLVESWRQRAPAIEWSLSCDESTAELPEEVATDLYRMVQEGLTNIARHSKAGFARVSVGAAQGALRILIEDDGRGIDPAAPRGYGLLGIAERARRLGGELEVDSDASGTRLRVRLALAPQALVAATDGES